MKINKKSKRYYALKKLAEGKPQSWLVNKKGYNASRLCRDVKYFINQGWLEEVKPTSYPKFYHATPKAPLGSTEEKGKVLHSPDLTRLHNTRWRMDILSEPKREISWDKVTPLKNGVKKYYMYFPSITIEYIPNKKSYPTVIVYPCGKYLDDAETDKHIEIIKNDMSVVRGWLQRVLLCRLSFPFEIVEKHFAKPIRNPEIMRVLNKVGVIRINDCWIDASKMGFRFGEIESTDSEKARVMKMLEWGDAGIPTRVNVLEKELSDVAMAIKDLPNQISDMIAPNRPLPPDDFSYM